MRKAVGCTVLLVLLVVIAIGVSYYWTNRPLFLTAEGKRQAITRLDQPAKSFGLIVGSDVFVKAAERIAPAVVNIDVIGQSAQQMDIFGNRMLVQGKGSGVIISPDGFIVTNNHVVGLARKIAVTLHDGSTYPAVLVGTDPDTDLAVIKIAARSIAAADLGDSDKVKVGEFVMAVGNPLGFENTVTLGIVSALHRNFDVDRRTRFANAIQTDASINHGNSGGALANVHGQLVGINAVIAGGSNASIGENSGSIGIGFAIPVNTVRRIARQLISNGRVPRPYMGVSYFRDFSEARQFLRVDPAVDLQFPDTGLWVRDVIYDSPAMSAGIQPNDILISVAGKRIKDRWDFTAELEQHKIGETIQLTVWRNGREAPVKITLGERPPR